MTVPEEMEDMNAVADKLLKDKCVKAVPVPMPELEVAACNAIHVLSLPTLHEIRKELGMLILKHAAGIGLILAGWVWLSCALDEIAYALGY